MSAADQHPPADRRCQLYSRNDFSGEIARCTNQGTHWVRWGGCPCGDVDGEFCESEFESWECDGPCAPEWPEAA